MDYTFSKELIFDRIKDSGFPFWGLSLRQGFNNRVNVMQYWGDDFTDDDTPESQIEKSIRRLDNIVASFAADKPDCEFVIEIRNSKNANGSGIIGPLSFVNEMPKAQAPATPAPPEPQKVTLAAVPEGYVPESMLKGVEERLEKQFEDKLTAYREEMERRQKEADYQRRCQELDNRERELKDLEKGYNSSVAKTSDTAVAILQKLGQVFLPMLMPGVAPDANPQLGAMQPEPPDPKSEIVDAVANLLYSKYSDAEIQVLLNDLKARKDATTTDLQTKVATTSTAAV